MEKLYFMGTKNLYIYHIPIDLSHRAECRKIIFRARKSILTEIQGSKNLKTTGGTLIEFLKKKFFFDKSHFYGLILVKAQDLFCPLFGFILSPIFWRIYSVPIAFIYDILFVHNCPGWKVCLEDILSLVSTNF